PRPFTDGPIGPRASPSTPSVDAYCAHSTSQAPEAPRTRPIRIPAMTIGPANAREPVGRQRNAASDEPVSPSEAARAQYGAARGGSSRKKPLFAGYEESAVSRAATSVFWSVGPVSGTSLPFLPLLPA